MSSGYILQTNETEFMLSSATPGIQLSCVKTSPVTEEQIAEMETYPLDVNLKLKGAPYPATKRAVIIMHGIGGHKNYTYHSKLARKLAHEQGITSIRFDFRNCGSSTKTGRLGRTLQNDIDDCQAVFEYLLKEGYSVDALIGHSRGVVDVFNWQLKHKDTFVPNLVACAGRFIGKGLSDSIRRKHPNFEKEGGHTIQGFQDGAYRDVFVPLAETESLSELFMTTVSEITKYSNTTTVYGLKEEIIPLVDAAHYANALAERNTLVFIPNATHSYYSTDKIPKEEWGHTEVPVNEKLCRLDYNYQVTDTVAEWLSTESVRCRFYERNMNIHEFLPRWKNVEGVANFRDVGGWQTAMPTWSTGKHIKWGRIFRCASIDHMTVQGQQTLLDLGVKKVFDFRSGFEVGSRDFQLLGDVEFVSLAAEDITQDGAKFYLAMAKTWKNYINVYEFLLEEVVPTYKPVFEHLRDSQDPILYHCTAGKDRTGILTAVILKMLKVPNEIIAAEYELTTEGLKPSHKKLSQFVAPILEKHGLPEHPSVDNLLASKYEVMLETLLNFDQKYESIDSYLSSKLGLSQADLSAIRTNLLF